MIELFSMNRFRIIYRVSKTLDFESLGKNKLQKPWVLEKNRKLLYIYYIKKITKLFLFEKIYQLNCSLIHFHG